MEVALRLAREAGVLIREGRSAAEVSSTKSSSTDIVTQMDLASEALLRRRLAQWRPDDAILGEEGDDTPGTSGITWVLDPIDGTVNYFYGIPHYAVSVAAVTGDVRNGAWTRIAGAVYDGEGVEWTAALGHGAYRNGVRLMRTEGPGLAGTLLGTGFQYIAQRRVAQGRILAQMLGRVRDIRRLGSASVDMCLAAAGTLDAYYEHGLQPWDFAAGALIASEAGLRVAGIDGGDPDSHLTIVAIPAVWDELRDALEEAGARQPWDSPRA
jgi:myo-inositol-1(or 4)-monophosphatase